MNFDSKEQLIEKIKEQFGVVLPNEKSFLNEDEHLLYTQLPKAYEFTILSWLDKNGIQHCAHTKHNYWLYLQN